MDDAQFGGAVPAFAPLRIQKNSLGAFGFGNGQNGLYPLKGSAALNGTALSEANFGGLLLPGPNKPRSVDLILFVWQFLTWGVLNLHEAQQKYTPKQDTVLSYLNSQFTEDGAYMMPTFAPGTSREKMEKQMTAMEGKPWVQLVYHKSMDGMSKMYMNMGRSLLVNIFIIWLLCWLLVKIPSPSFATVFIGTLGAGLIVFLHAP